MAREEPSRTIIANMQTSLVKINFLAKPPYMALFNANHQVMTAATGRANIGATLSKDGKKETCDDLSYP
jgi:hypothetical protein